MDNRNVPAAEFDDFEWGFESGGAVAFGMSAVIALIYAGVSLLPVPRVTTWFWLVNAATVMTVLGGLRAWSAWRGR